MGRDLNTAVNAIRCGGVIAYPTEGVFGLGCDPNNPAAIDALLTLKGRAAEKGFILIAADRDHLKPFIKPLDTTLDQKLDQTWPGPVTWILPCNATAPTVLTGGKPGIATRVTDHPVASDLCKACNSAIISTSANKSGEPACTDAASVAEVFGNELAYILDYPVGNLSGPTPIFDGITGKQLR